VGAGHTDHGLHPGDPARRPAGHPAHRGTGGLRRRCRLRRGDVLRHRRDRAADDPPRRGPWGLRLPHGAVRQLPRPRDLVPVLGEPDRLLPGRGRGRRRRRRRGRRRRRRRWRRFVGPCLDAWHADHRGRVVGGAAHSVQPAALLEGGAAGVGDPRRALHPPSPGADDLSVHSDARPRGPVALRAPGRYLRHRARTTPRAAPLHGRSGRVHAPRHRAGRELREPLSLRPR
jgi:hypothetical protein